MKNTFTARCNDGTIVTLSLIAKINKGVPMFDARSILELLGSMRRHTKLPDNGDIAIALRKIDADGIAREYGEEIAVAVVVIVTKISSLEGAHGIMPMLGKEALYRMLIEAKHEAVEETFKWLQSRDGTHFTEVHRSILLELARKHYPATDQDLADQIDLEFANA